MISVPISLSATRYEPKPPGGIFVPGMAWPKAKQVAENSHILKDKFKTEVLQSKFDEDKDIKEKQKEIVLQLSVLPMHEMRECSSVCKECKNSGRKTDET